MKYIFTGALFGACLSFFLFRSSPAIEIYAQYYLPKKELGSLPVINSGKKISGEICKFKNRVYQISLTGDVEESFELPDSLCEFSGDGRFYISYDRVGTEIELHSLSGERFWKIKSRERPFLSHNSKLILLLNGDQSRIRIMDQNGKATGDREISGRICTSIVFSGQGDEAALGFADGSFHFINSGGKITFSARTKVGTAVKSLAVSDNGKFGAIHYGDPDHDFLKIVNIAEGKSSDVPVKTVQHTRSAISINNSGLCSFFDSKTLSFHEPDGDIVFSRDMPEKRIGLATLDTERELTVLSYGLKRGGAQFYVFQNDGTLIFAKRFRRKTFLSSKLDGKFINSEGSGSLFSYSLEVGH